MPIFWKLFYLCWCKYSIFIFCLKNNITETNFCFKKLFKLPPYASLGVESRKLIITIQYKYNLVFWLNIRIFYIFCENYFIIHNDSISKKYPSCEGLDVLPSISSVIIFPFSIVYFSWILMSWQRIFITRTMFCIIPFSLTVPAWTLFFSYSCILTDTTTWHIFHPLSVKY